MTGTGDRLPARKRFGQHFLEPAWAARLVDAIAPQPADTFLEIGPGRGALTRLLAERARRVVAVEIDRDLAGALRRGAPAHLRVVEGDFLNVDLSALLQPETAPLRVAGNLPYNRSSAILFRLLEAARGGRQFSDATLMLQKEVADRVAARPAASNYGALAVQVALSAAVEHLLTVPPGAFRPAPQVMSAVIRLRFHPPEVDIGDRATFAWLVRGLFQHRRKTLLNALKPLAGAKGMPAADVLARAGLDPGCRPQELTLPDMAALVKAVL